ncbi:MAG TPA: hypothetical protein VNM90_29960, partial [Haliangium sp.]|nr:hypothetical protein [Haliangium sp.]
LANDGDKVVGVFVGEPLAREVVWTGEKYLDVKSPDAEKYLKKGRSSSLRVAMNIYVLAENAVKVYEMGATVFKDVFKLRDKYGLDTWAFEIERHGGKGDNKTSYTILPEQRLDDAMRRKIAQLELHDLEKVLSNTEDGDAGDEERGFDSYEDKQDAPKDKRDRPIDSAILEQVMPRLKVLPRERIDEFLKQFKVQRVKDLRAGDHTAVLEFLSRIEAARQPPREIDPFA